MININMKGVTFMKKLLWASVFTCLLIMLLIPFTTIVFAAQANPFPHEVKQADGTVITIFNCGDEFFNWSEDKDGYIIAYDEGSNNWCYASIDGNSITTSSQIVSENRSLRFDNLQAYSGRIKKDALLPLIKQVDRSVANIMVEPNRGSGSLQSGLTPIEHTKNRQPLLVLLIDYNDRQFSTAYALDTMAYWSNHFFGNSGKTVNTYYKEVSGSFDLQFTKPIFTVANGYSVNNPITGVSSAQIKDGVARVRLNKNHPNTTVLGGVVRDDVSLAFNAVKQYINFSSISQVWDTILCEDFNVTSVIAGFDASASAPMPYIWAHASQVYYNNINGKTRNISIAYNDPTGVLRTYATQGELYNANVAMPIGVSVHELGHVLGLRDLYSNIGGNGIGPYSVMAGGSWGTDTSGDTKQGNTPTHFDAWSKARLGFEIPTIITSVEYWKNNVKSIADDYNILQITNTVVDPTQYFMIENRQRNFGFDRGLSGLGVAGSGVLIYHIDERVHSGYYYDENTEEWTGRPNDNDMHKFMHVEGYNPSNNPFYISNGIFNPTSTPNSNFHIAGHISNPTIHTNCHPQTLASGIYVKVNSASGNSMEVEVGSKLTVTIPNLAYNGTNNTFTLGVINYSEAIALQGKNIHAVINKRNSSGIILNTASNSTISISASGIGTWSSLPTIVNSFAPNEYIEILAYENSTTQISIARQIVNPILFTY